VSALCFCINARRWQYRCARCMRAAFAPRGHGILPRAACVQYAGVCWRNVRGEALSMRVRCAWRGGQSGYASSPCGVFYAYDKWAGVTRAGCLRNASVKCV
jgi:hypothetical protein